MKYYIKRDLNEYGPYTLADIQRYTAQGNILMTDLARSEGLNEWVPVSQVLGNIPVPVQAPAIPAAAGTVYQGTPGYGVAAAPAISAGPMPPDFHWAFVFLIGLLCSFFPMVWFFIEAAFVKKIKPESNFLAFLIGGLGAQFGSIIVLMVGAGITASAGDNNPPVVALLLFALVLVAGIVLWIVGVFKMRDEIEDYYNTVEPINLRLSGVMTFFFSFYYFQHHFTRIAQWKKTGVLEPQG